MSSTPVSSNRYILLDHLNREVDVFTEAEQGWGRDYILKVLASFEGQGLFSGLIFFIAYHPPEHLPQYGDNVVLVILGDELHLHRAYFAQIGAILRCHGVLPVYSDGFPTRLLHIAAFLQYVQKTAVHLKWRLSAFWRDGRGGLANVASKTLQIPLGLFQNHHVHVKPIGNRTIDYSFMGSITEDMAGKSIFQRILAWPKAISRRRMLEEVDVLNNFAIGKKLTTAGFEQSIRNIDEYNEILADTKISLVPRGTSYETYRFFEACKLGCVVVCDPLPKVWYTRNHPGIVLKDWSRLPDLIRGLLADRPRLEALSAASLQYWNNTVGEAAVAQHIARFLQVRLAKFVRREPDRRLPAQ